MCPNQQFQASSQCLMNKAKTQHNVPVPVWSVSLSPICLSQVWHTISNDNIMNSLVLSDSFNPPFRSKQCVRYQDSYWIPHLFSILFWLPPSIIRVANPREYVETEITGFYPVKGVLWLRPSRNIPLTQKDPFPLQTMQLSIYFAKQFSK